MSEKKVEAETKAPEAKMTKEDKDAKDVKNEPKAEEKSAEKSEETSEAKKEVEEKDNEADESKEEESKVPEEAQATPSARPSFLTKMKSKFFSKAAPEVTQPEPKEEFVLPIGDHDLQLYSMATHNGQKITCALEEMGLKYDAWFIDISKGDQLSKAFLEVNPNGKIPVLVDKKGIKNESVSIFETGSILLYLAEKSKKLLPTDPKLKLSCMNWLFFQAGAEPAFGQLRHYNKIAPTKIKYSLDRSSKEIQRLVKVLDDHLVEKDYIVGNELTIVDIAWFTMIASLEPDYTEVIGLAKYEQLKRWKENIQSREAIQKGMKINSPKEEHAEFKEYHSSA